MIRRALLVLTLVVIAVLGFFDDAGFVLGGYAVTAQTGNPWIGLRW